MTIDRQTIESMFRNRKPRPIGKHRFFSVLIPFVEREGKLYLMLEVRAKDMDSQPGEICFPGGHMEPGETPRESAVRENYEETGIPAECIDLIGKGNTLFGYANYTLFTNIGILNYDDFLKAKISEDEVDELFLISFDDLFDVCPEIYTEKIHTDISEDFPYEKVGIDENYSWRVGKWQIPILEVEGRVIWGLTAWIILDLIGQFR